MTIRTDFFAEKCSIVILSSIFGSTIFDSHQNDPIFHLNRACAWVWNQPKFRMSLGESFRIYCSGDNCLLSMKCLPRASRPSDPSLFFIVCLEKDLRSIATVMKSVCSTHSRSMYILSSKLLQLSFVFFTRCKKESSTKRKSWTIFGRCRICVADVLSDRVLKCRIFTTLCRLRHSTIFVSWYVRHHIRLLRKSYF